MPGPGKSWLNPPGCVIVEMNPCTPTTSDESDAGREVSRPVRFPVECHFAVIAVRSTVLAPSVSFEVISSTLYRNSWKVAVLRARVVDAEGPREVQLGYGRVLKVDAGDVPIRTLIREYRLKLVGRAERPLHAVGVPGALAAPGARIPRFGSVESGPSCDSWPDPACRTMPG